MDCFSTWRHRTMFLTWKQHHRSLHHRRLQVVNNSQEATAGRSIIAFFDNFDDFPATLLWHASTEQDLTSRGYAVFHFGLLCKSLPAWAAASGNQAFLDEAHEWLGLEQLCSAHNIISNTSGHHTETSSSLGELLWTRQRCYRLQETDRRLARRHWWLTWFHAQQQFNSSQFWH